MKLGLPSSIALHALVLGWGLVTLSAPKAYDVADVEALPVDVVPFSAVSHVQVGDKKAPAKDKSAPKPTVKPPVVKDAKNVGDNEVDLKTPPKPKPAPKKVEAAEQPKAAPPPVTKPTPTPDPSPPKKPEPVPAPEVATKAQPKQEVKPDPVAETIASANPDAASVKLPENVPTPEARPKPPKAETARTPDRQDTQKPPVQPSQRVASKDDKSLDDKIAALLNHEKSAGGGALRSDQTASLGGDTDSGGEKLTQSEMDALRAQIQRCWSPPVGVSDASDLKISIKMRLDPSGALESDPKVIAGGSDGMLGRVAAESAMRAVMRCAPYKLPPDKYAAWSDVIVNFDPSQMF